MDIFLFSSVEFCLGSTECVGVEIRGVTFVFKDSYGGHISFRIIRTCILMLNARFFSMGVQILKPSS